MWEEVAERQANEGKIDGVERWGSLSEEVIGERYDIPESADF